MGVSWVISSSRLPRMVPKLGCLVHAAGIDTSSPAQSDSVDRHRVPFSLSLSLSFFLGYLSLEHVPIYTCTLNHSIVCLVCMTAWP